MQAILVARDHDEREIVTFILRHTGLSVATTQDLQRVATNWLERPADIIIVSASEVAELKTAVTAVRDVTGVPLLLLAEAMGERQLCTLLEAGVDLVLTRPVAPRVLAHYVKALLRRAGGVPSFVLPSLSLQEIELDPATRTVTVTGQEAQRLTQLEFRLLYVLMTNRDQVVPSENIVERVWGYSGEGNRELVRGLISRVRRKVEPDPDDPRFIQTVPGTGYMFTLEP